MVEFNDSKWRREKLKEGVKEAIAKSIPDSYNYDKLAKDIAEIVKDDYGSHNIKPFIKSIIKYLG